MLKISSYKELEFLREKFARDITLRESAEGPGGEQDPGTPLPGGSASPKYHLLVCGGTGCRASESDRIIQNLRTEIEYRGLSDRAGVYMTGCFGFCEKGPIVKVFPDNTFYTQVTPDDCAEIVESHVGRGQRVERLLYVDPENGRSIEDSVHMGFYRKQVRIALRNCGLIDPENIEEYIARDGYRALAQVLESRDASAAVEVIKRSGLRGPRRGRIPYRHKVGGGRPSAGRPEIRGLQCRRGRPRGVYGPFYTRRRPRFDNRGYGHLRLLHRSH